SPACRVNAAQPIVPLIETECAYPRRSCCKRKMGAGKAACLTQMAEEYSSMAGTDVSLKQEARSMPAVSCHDQYGTGGVRLRFKGDDRRPSVRERRTEDRSAGT